MVKTYSVVKKRRTINKWKKTKKMAFQKQIKMFLNIRKGAQSHQ